MHGKPGPFFWDGNFPSDLDWCSEHWPGLSGLESRPTGAWVGAKLSFCDPPAVPVTPSIKLE